MHIPVNIALLTWPVGALLFFFFMPPRRAILATYMIGWLFLPVAEIDLQGFPSYDKLMAVSLGAFLGSVLFDMKTWRTYRLKWYDSLPLFYTLSPIFSSLSNDLGAYDALSAAFRAFSSVGMMYFLGRMYFADLKAMRELAIWAFIFGLIYVPLCLYEIRMSPQLHTMVYGHHQHSFSQTMRFGGWRPTVFMKHGLRVSIWMTTASLAGLWLWRTKSLVTLAGVPMGFLVCVLYATTIACKSVNGWVLLTIGTCWFFLLRKWPSTWTFWFMLIVPNVYIALRAAGLWDGTFLVILTESLFGSDRAQSIDFRLSMEEVLVERARGRPIFGWSPWYFRPEDQRIIADSTWMINFGSRGVIGLAVHFALFFLPVGLLMRRLPVATWSHPLTAGPLFFASMLMLVNINQLFNTVNAPIYTLMVGALLALSPSASNRDKDPVHHRTGSRVRE